MIVELAFILFFSIFCLASKPKNILIFMFLLLPLHGFIKFMFFSSGGEVFSTWKEIGIVFLWLKSIKIKNYFIKYISFSYIILIGYFSLFFIIGYKQGYSILSDVRQYIFPTLLLIGVAKTKFLKKDLDAIFISIAIGSILINITGIIDFISPTLRLGMRTIMGAEFQIDSSGNIYYDNSSFSIMGIERVAGLMGGGPNMMGVFNSSILICLLIANRLKCFIGKKKFIFLLSISLCVFCLLFSFSRAGWAIVLITIFIILLNDRRYRKVAIQYAFLFLILSVIIYFTVDTFREVIDGTLSGNEASSASRASMTQSSLSQLLSEPFGHGMGAANHDGKIYYAFAESSLINLGFCAGIFGIVLYLIHVLTVYRANKRNRKYNFIAIYSSAFIVAYSITACVSVNVFQNPFIYYAWFLMGLGLTRPFVKPFNSKVK